MALDKKLYQNAKKPEGAGGVFMMNRMNERHRHMAKWGFSTIAIEKDDIALDVGCGGGANLEKLLEKIPNNKVCGIDYAQVSVSLSKKKNKKAVNTGRCEVLQADVGSLPFEDDSFTLITAFETVYFWPDMSKALREIYRVLKVGGRFMICNEDDGLSNKENSVENIIEGMKIYKGEELELMLKEANFKNIKINRKVDKPWISLVAEK